MNKKSILVKVIGLALLVVIVPFSFVFAQDDAMTIEEANKEIVIRFLNGFDESDDILSGQPFA